MVNLVFFDPEDGMAKIQPFLPINTVIILLSHAWNLLILN